MADKPARGLADVVAASTALSDIDGKAGRLFYRGYDIHDLAGRVSFEECVYLLQRGKLPNRAELDRFTAELAANRVLGKTVEALLPLVAQSGTPMEALRSLVSVLSADDPDAGDSSPEANERKALRLVAQMPVLVARYHAARTGTTVPEPDPELGIAGNFLLQITGKRPGEREARIFDECLVLHADHTMNASTFTARVIAATLSDMHSAITGAMGALRGPLHGGANEAVMKTLQSIEGGVDGVEAFVRETLGAGKKIMGFGHRVYKTEDPRATHLRKLSEELAEITGNRLYYDMSRKMEQVVKEVKGLYPNVDFYAASVYHYLGIPTDLFTPVFAISRMSGWTAHVMEQQADNRLIRPDSEYIGPRGQKWVPIDERP
ncbi:citrate synthase [Carbonactinospora thermoautotrophica]|uniref:Citrate synthase n=1 Tax=Carbonactinospora thermoautotrophica TaxID=1469144 RepID=A0A132MXI9_9ACTN|nr:citrate/2-methylcitrate synthase [Carbonactinospora thermoautotrophica]KWX02537.1 Citrate synthase (si) [Carbonactinospora thermoautotrophica]KWX03635.1 citrate synthase [Carbonactinospora thermoautotrophica]KWX08856.1 citrate synthase [Carbonactinospora thermoautotrophica]